MSRSRMSRNGYFFLAASLKMPVKRVLSAGLLHRLPPVIRRPPRGGAAQGAGQRPGAAEGAGQRPGAGRCWAGPLVHHPPSQAEPGRAVTSGRGGGGQDPPPHQVL
jgi:hypothetical protein